MGIINNELEYVCLPFSKLSGDNLYRLLQLRSEVFVVEQTCIYQDLDGKDTHPSALHLLAFKQSQLLAYARILPSGLSYATPSIGRIVVNPSFRGANMGRLVIKEAIVKTKQTWPNKKITIGAQAHLVNLYREFGFECISDEYLEDGIPHIDMQL